MKRWERAFLEYADWSPQSELSALSPAPVSKAGARKLMVFDLRLFGCSFMEIADYLGVSKSRARQIYNNGLRHMQWQQNKTRRGAWTALVPAEVGPDWWEEMIRDQKALEYENRWNCGGNDER